MRVEHVVARPCTIVAYPSVCVKGYLPFVIMDLGRMQAEGALPGPVGWVCIRMGGLYPTDSKGVI